MIFHAYPPSKSSGSAGLQKTRNNKRIVLVEAQHYYPRAQSDSAYILATSFILSLPLGTHRITYLWISSILFPITVAFAIYHRTPWISPCATRRPLPRLARRAIPRPLYTREHPHPHILLPASLSLIINLGSYTVLCMVVRVALCDTCSSPVRTWHRWVARGGQCNYAVAYVANESVSTCRQYRSTRK